MKRARVGAALVVFTPLLVAAFLACATAHADDELVRVDAAVRAEMQKQKIPGVAIAVVRKGGLVLAKGYGDANVEHHVPVKPETIFESGSVGKQFTAAAVMLQVEDGKLAVEDPITKYFSDAPDTWKASP